MDAEAQIATLLRRDGELATRLAHVEAYRAKLVRENDSLREENAILKEKVRELTARVNQDSSNSSKPPSSDKPWKDRRPQKPTGRSRGGQPGHAGKTREPFPPEEVDHRVPVKPESCGDCGHDLGDDDLTGGSLAHQVVEIPPVVAEVWEYVFHEALCPGCGETTMAMLPDGVPTTCIGVRFQAILALLSGRCRLTRRETRDTVMALFGEKARISVGTVSAMEKRTSEALAPAYDEALAKIQNADVVNADETSWRESNKLAWLWAAVTPLLTVFRIDKRRNREAFRKLLFNFDGILGTDRFSVYRIHDKERRQLCWAHILRNFLGLEELGGTAKSLGVGGQRIVKAVFREWYRFRNGEITRRGLQHRLAPLRLRLQRLLRRHVNNPAAPARKIAKDLREYGSALWTFARVEGVDPTNNIAERALRKAVLWRKSSFGSASAAGSRFVERMLTVCESLRAQGRSILDFLVLCIRARPDDPTRPTLMPMAG
ncbi:MAG: IS66 family transposase ISGob4 [Planctomycetes bacterium]|nr:IS66 family transposase ISGob4 [Planctomycetota bacterium]